MEKKVKENNMIIAEFDGWKHSGKGGNLANYYYKENQQSHSDDFKYNSSWNWLMPVAEKIEEMGTCHYVKIERWMHGSSAKKKYVCTIYSVTNFPDTVEFQSDNSKIEAAFMCIAEFIKQYNKLKKRK